MDSQNVDVNVTPDKLQMFIKSENVLLAIIKSSLIKMFARLLETISLNDSSFQCQNSTMLEFFTSTKSQTSKNSMGSRLASKGDDIKETNFAIKKTRENTHIQKRQREESEEDEDCSVINETVSSNISKQKRLDEFLDASPRPLGLKKDKHSPAKKSPNEKSQNIGHKAIMNNFSSNHENSNERAETFSINEKLNLFQNRIGAKDNANLLNSSTAERLDLHMCQWETTPKASDRQKTSVHENLKSLGLTQTQIDLDCTDSSYIQNNAEDSCISIESSKKPNKEKEPSLSDDTSKLSSHKGINGN